MGKEINVILADERLNLRKMERSELKGVYTDAVLSFSFYATSYKGCEFLLLAPKKKGPVNRNGAADWTYIQYERKEAWNR